MEWRANQCLCGNIFMDNGVVVENSTPEELFASENPRTQAFLGKYLAPDQQ